MKKYLYLQTTLIMAYERSESARDNFGKFIYQLQHKPEHKSGNLKDPNKII